MCAAVPTIPVVVTFAVRILVAGSNVAVPLPVAVLVFGGVSCAPVRVAANGRVPSSPPPQDTNAASTIADKGHISIGFALSDFIRRSPAPTSGSEP
jgi:hypothetical protein